MQTIDTMKLKLEIDAQNLHKIEIGLIDIITVMVEELVKEVYAMENLDE
jgi:hypothetical protein